MPVPWRIPFAKSLMRSLRGSLERLGLPSVHLYQIHGPISFRPARTVAAALAEAHRAGLVQAVGVSNYSEAEMRAIHAALAEHGIPLATNQVEYSLLRTMPEANGVLGACRELGVTLLAYSPMAMGRRTGKYSAANPPSGSRNFSAFPMTEIEPVIAALRAIGERRGGKTPAQARALGLNVVMPVRRRNTDQTEQNAGALGWRLNSDEIAALDPVISSVNAASSAASGSTDKEGQDFSFSCSTLSAGRGAARGGRVGAEVRVLLARVNHFVWNKP
jgi:aryl-alcohol dehydrogenase-like predicted oxidoreductase